MADLTVSNDIDTFMQSANNAAARNSLGLGNVDNTADANKPVSTAQQAALDTEAATRLAADNRRAFAGGVALDGVSGEIVAQKTITFGDTDFTISRYADLSNYAVNARIFHARTTGNGVDIKVNSSGEIEVFFADDLTSTSIDTSTGGTIGSKAGYFSFVFDRFAKSCKIYLDGDLEATLDLSSVTGFLSAETFHVGSQSGNAPFSEDTVNGLFLHNRALSSTEAAELSEIGLGAWLAVHPEDKWGQSALEDFENGETAASGSAIVIFDNFGATHSNYDGVTDPDSIGGAQDGNFCAKVVNPNKNGFRIRTDSIPEQTFRISLWYYIKTGDPNLSIVNTNLMDTNPQSNIISGSLTVKDTWTKVVFLSKTGVGNPGIPLIRQTTAGTFYIDSVNVETLGALACLPMDEGIGRQLRDLSSNHYDALLSETGYQHLQPKNEGYVRVKGADASSAIYMLEASDVMPADAVITDIIAEERKVDVANTAQDLADNRIRLNPSGSDLQIQRSDGTNHDTLGTVTAPTSLSDIDAEIHYKQQAR